MLFEKLFHCKKKGRINRRKMTVHVDGVEPFKNEKFEGFSLYWSGNIGFGQYVIYRGTGENEWHADSECMDSNDDKWFIKRLLLDFVSQVKIDEVGRK